MKSIRIAVLVPVLCLVLAVAVSANGGFGGTSPRVGGSIVFEHAPHIQVAAESLHINLAPTQAAVTVTYTLENTGPAMDGGYVFPVSHYVSYYDDAQDVATHIRFYDGDTRLPSRRVTPQPPEPEAGDDRYAYYIIKQAQLGGVSYDYEYIQNIYYHVDLSFAPGETKTLTVAYQMPCAYSASSSSVVLLNDYSPISFFYDLTPASAWGDGKAARFDVTVDYTMLGSIPMESNLPGFESQPDGVYHYSTENLDFAQTGMLYITYTYPFWLGELAEYQAESTILSAVYASSTLPDAQGRYSAQNLFDGDPDTAWSTEGSGIGQYIELDFKETAAIGIRNGFTRSEQLYYDNARIKSLTAEVWHVYPDGQLLFDYSREYQLPDIPYSDLMARDPLETATLMLDFLDRGRLVRLTITDIYPGRKYQDTCVSELYLFSHQAYRYGGSEEPVPVADASLVENWPASSLPEAEATQPPATTSPDTTRPSRPVTTAPRATRPSETPPDAEPPLTAEATTVFPPWLAVLLALAAAGGGFALGRRKPG